MTGSNALIMQRKTIRKDLDFSSGRGFFLLADGLPEKK